MRVASLLAAAATLAVALSASFDARADASFAWHMAQHLILLFAVPFFALASRPFDVLARSRARAIVPALVRNTRSLHGVAHPVVALCLFVAVLWCTHYSGLYERSLEFEPVHVLEHLLYLSAGTIFWLPVLAPPPLRPPAFPIRLLYLIVAMPQGALLAFALDSARIPLYRHYVEVSSYPAALADQANAAAVMWIGGGLVLFTAFLSTFGAWALRESRALHEPLPGELR